MKIDLEAVPDTPENRRDAQMTTCQVIGMVFLFASFGMGLLHEWITCVITAVAGVMWFYVAHRFFKKVSTQTEEFTEELED